MILDVSRGHIKVALFGKTITVPGEMFFPPNDKIGFAVYLDQVKCWDAPNQKLNLTEDELEAVIRDIREDFEKGGHILEVE